MTQHISQNIITSVSPRLVTLNSSTTVEVFPPSSKRIGAIISASTFDFSLSFSPQITLGSGSFNFFASLPFVLILSYIQLGISAQTPIWGIAGGDGGTIEVTDILFEGTQVLAAPAILGRGNYGK